MKDPEKVKGGPLQGIFLPKTTPDMRLHLKKKITHVEVNFNLAILLWYVLSPFLSLSLSHTLEHRYELNDWKKLKPKTRSRDICLSTYIDIFESLLKGLRDACSHMGGKSENHNDATRKKHVNNTNLINKLDPQGNSVSSNAMEYQDGFVLYVLPFS